MTTANQKATGNELGPMYGTTIGTVASELEKELLKHAAALRSLVESLQCSWNIVRSLIEFSGLRLSIYSLLLHQVPLDLALLLLNYVFLLLAVPPAGLVFALHFLLGFILFLLFLFVQPVSFCCLLLPLHLHLLGFLPNLQQC